MSQLILTVQIKEKTVGGWYLTLTNTLTSETFDIDNIFAFNEQMEAIASEHKTMEPLVEWLDASHISPNYVNEIRQQLLRFNEQNEAG